MEVGDEADSQVSHRLRTKIGTLRMFIKVANSTEVLGSDFGSC